MVDRSNRQALAWCVFLALGLCLTGLGGLVSLHLIADLSGDSPPRLLEMGGPLSLSVGGLLLSMAFASRRWGRLSALLLVLLASLILVVAVDPGYAHQFAIPPVSALPALPILMIVGCFGSLLAMSSRPPRGILLGLSVCVVSVGVVNLLIQEPATPAWARLTVVPNLATAKATLVVLFGAVLPLMPRLYHNPPGPYARPVLWVGAAGIVITLVGWQAAQYRLYQGLEQRAQLIANATAESIQNFYDSELAAVGRLAERIEAQGAGLSADLWEQETESYFRDLPFLEVIAILDHRMGVQRLAARDFETRFWLGDVFDTAEFRAWHRDRRHETGRIRSSALFIGPTEQLWTFFSAPIRIGETRQWSLLALVDTETALTWLAQRPTNGFNLRLISDERALFDSQLIAPDVREVFAETSIEFPLSTWTLSVSRSNHESYLGEYLTSTLILLGGFALTTLTMVSRLFGVIATDHNEQLQKTNVELKHYLEREQILRETNQRIIDFSSDLLCTIDQRGYFTFVSPASTRILGYSPEEMEDRPARDFVYEQDWDKSLNEVARLGGGQSSGSLPLRNRYRHRAGHLVTLDWKARFSSEDGAMFCVGRDVTAELKVEELAQQREAFFSITPEMFCIVNGNFFVEVNQAFLDTLGYDREALLTSPYREIIHPDYLGIIEDAVAEMQRGKKVHDLELLAFHQDGDMRWLRLSAAMSDGRIYCSARDITQEKVFQKTLQEKEQLLTLAEQMGRLGGWFFDLGSREPVWSDAVCEIHDLSPENVPTVDEAIAYYTEEYRPQIEEAVRLASELGLPFDLEAQIVSAKGRLRWVRAIGQAVRDEHGTITALQGAFQDITESKAASEQIRKLAERQTIIFESITDAFFTLDPNWQFTFVNARCEQLLERSREELLGKNFWQAFPEAVGTAFEEHYRQALATGETASFEAYFAPLDLWSEVKAYPSEEGLAVYFRSINERKRAEQERDATMAELKRSNRELQDFAFVASHDLQEPLRKIQTFSDRLLRNAENFGEREQDYLTRMQSAANRMQTLIMDLLTYSRVSTRTQPFQGCDLNRIIGEVMQDLETAIGEADAQIDVSKLPTLNGDPSQLRQVIQNLLSNALKFRRAGVSPHIRIYAEENEEGGWTLVVKDNGAGFDPRYADRMFQPFQRLHSRKEYAGTGIGLAIVRKIVERHQGKITAEAKPGEGATFRINFMTPIESKAKSDRRAS